MSKKIDVKDLPVEEELSADDAKKVKGGGIAGGRPGGKSQLVDTDFVFGNKGKKKPATSSNLGGEDLY